MTPHKENHLKKALFATDGVSAIHVPGTARWYWAEANDTMDHRRVVKVWRATGPSEDSVIWRFYGLDVTDLVGTAHYPHSMESHPTIRHLRKIAVLIGTRYTDYTLTSDLLRLVTTHGIVQCMDLADVPIVAVTYQYWDVRQQALKRLAGESVT